jgi:predicted phosphodiesterase
MADTTYNGILAIGDPHLASRVPGFRRDEYPEAILEKLDWCLTCARRHSLLPVLLGDLFNWPRDNANWLLVRLMEIIREPVLAVPGNHDCAENTLKDDDSLMVLVKARKVVLLDQEGPWTGEMNDRPVIVGGSPWGPKIPKRYPPEGRPDLSRPEGALVVWITHYMIGMPGCDEAHYAPHEIPGVDVVINGHLHRTLESVQKGGTLWLNPGNIARVLRGDATRDHVPKALRLDVQVDTWSVDHVEIPHRPFDEVFHPTSEVEIPEIGDSQFVKGLADLQARRTATGAGLDAFLDENLQQFPDDVADHIRKLAEEVREDGQA